MSVKREQIRDGILQGDRITVTPDDTCADATRALLAMLDGASPTGQIAQIKRLLQGLDGTQPLVQIRVEEIHRLLETVETDLHNLPALARAWSLLREAAVLPAAQIGDKVVRGPQSRDDFEDKQAVIGIVKRLIETLPYRLRTLREWTAHKELAPYSIKYKGNHTLRDWINEAAPGVLKVGRPRKHPVT